MGKSTISMVIFNSFLLNYQRVFLLPMAIPWQRPGLISYSAVVEPDALRRAAALKALDGQGAPARSSKLFHAVPSCQQWLFHVSRQWFIGFIKNPYNYIYTYIYIYMVGAGIIERKLRSTKVRLFTVPCCSIILFSSEGRKKTYLNLLLTFFVVL